MVNENKDLKLTDKKFVVPTTPKTETKIILEQQDLYPDLNYEDISLSRGYGPCKWNNPNCSCSTAELERQATELKVQREREALEYERKQREQEEKKRWEEEKRREEENRRYLQEQRGKWPWARDSNWRERGGQAEQDKWPWQREKKNWWEKD